MTIMNSVLRKFGSLSDWAVAFSICAAGAANADVKVLQVKPSITDSSISSFDEPNIVLVDSDAAPSAKLILFLPGTEGSPANAIPMLKLLSPEGNRAIALEYNSSPSIAELCKRTTKFDCFSEQRESRVFPPMETSLDEPKSGERILSRLVSLIRYLCRTQPTAGWQRYIDSRANIRWESVVIAGFSQGAGMAALIAKRFSVARVVLLSGPWDHVKEGRSLQFAGWLSEPSLTPLQRWFAAYDVNERNADLLAGAYKVLRVPRTHVIGLASKRLRQDQSYSGDPHHVDTIRDLEFADSWRLLFLGHATNTQ